LTKILTKILSVAIIAAGVGFFLNLTIDNPYSHKLVRTIINEKLKQYEKLHLEFQALEVSALPLGVTLYGFRVTAAQNPDAVLVEAANVKVRVSVPSLLLGTPRLSLMEANELKFKYPLHPDFAALFSSSEEGTPITWPLDFDLPVDQLALTNAQIDLTLPGEKPTDPNILDLSLTGLNARFSYDDWKDWALETNIQSMNLACLGKAFIKQAQVNIDGKFRNNRFDTSEFSVASENLSLNGSSVVQIITEKIKNAPLAARISTDIISSLSIVSNANIENSNLKTLGDFLGIDNTDGKVAGDIEFLMNVPIEQKEASTTWNITGDASVLDGRIYGFKLYDTQTSLFIDQDKIKFDQAAISKEGNLLAYADGVIHFDDALRMEFHAKPEDLPLVDLMEAVRVPDFKVLNGNISSEKITVSGQAFPFNLKVETDALVEDVTFPILNLEKKPDLRPSCDLGVSLDVNAKQLNFQKMRGTCFLQTENQKATESALDVAGDIFFDSNKGLNLKIASPNFNLGLTEFITGLHITGPAEVKTTIAGPYADIVTTVDIQGNRVSVFNIPGQLTSKVSVSAKAGEARIQEAQIKLENGGSITAKDTVIKFAEGVPFQTSLDASNVDAGFFRNLIGAFTPEQKIEFGAQRLKGQLNGLIMSPLAAQGTLKAILNDGKMGDEGLFDNLEIDVESDTKSIQTTNLLYEKGALKVNGTVNVTKQKPFSYSSAKDSPDVLVRLGLNRSDKVEITATVLKDSEAKDHLKEIPFLGKYLIKSGVESQIEADVELSGTIDHLEGKFDGSFTNAKLLQTDISPIKFSGFVDGGKINVPVIAQAGNTLEGRLQLDVAKDGIPYNWYFKLNNFDVRALAAQIVSNDPRNFAYINTSWEMDGKLLDWWKSSGKLTLEKFSSKIVKSSQGRSNVFDLDLKNGVTIAMDKGKWSLAEGEEIILVSRGSELKVRLLDSVMPDKLQTEFEGSVDIQILQSLVPQIYAAKGKIEIAGSVTGPVLDPVVNLHIKDSKPSSFSHADWEPLTISFYDFNPPVSNVQMDISYVDGKWTIHQFRASKGTNGTIEVSGQMDLKSSNPNDSKILIGLSKAEFQRLPFFVLKSVNTTIDADLAIVGNKLPLKASGSLSIIQADSQGSFDIRQQIVDAIRKQKIKTNTAAKQSYFTFDIQLNSNNSVHINSKNLAATLGGDLYLTGTEDSPVLVGQVLIPQGRFTYKRDFDIRPGSGILFDEPISPPDPKLNVTGEAKVSRYTVQFILTGYASQPKVDFAIEPSTRPDGTPITKLDILLLLSSGSLPASDKSAGLSQSMAYNEALSVVIGQFEEPIEKLMELSGQSVIRQVYLDTYTSEATSSPVARLNLPINLSDDVNLIFQVDSESNMKISSEYSLHDSISISGGVDKKKEDELHKTNSSLVGDTGVDLRFRFNFP
jgi:hypothetical protein